jgi:hypothetical protein
MIKRIIGIALFILGTNLSYSQIIIPILFGEDMVPEHGFLPGRKFPIYKTVENYDFGGATFRVELYDDRENFKLSRIQCSNVDIENTSELSSKLAILKIKEYVDSIFRQSNIRIDSSESNTIEIRLQAIDSRLIGFGKIKVHGLCQLLIKFKDISRIYCVDIVDGDKNAPLGSNAIVTRKTASRFMASASIRECIEKFLVDLRQIK